MSDRTRVLVVSQDRPLRERLRTGVFALGGIPILTGDPDQTLQIAVDAQPSAAILDGQLVREDSRVRPASLRRVQSLAEAPFMLVASQARRSGLVRFGDDEALTIVERNLDVGSLAARLRYWLNVAEEPYAGSAMRAHSA